LVETKQMLTDLREQLEIATVAPVVFLGFGGLSPIAWLE
jgi:hypothetical protein